MDSYVGTPLNQSNSIRVKHTIEFSHGHNHVAGKTHRERAFLASALSVEIQHVRLQLCLVESYGVESDGHGIVAISLDVGCNHDSDCHMHSQFFFVAIEVANEHLKLSF